MKGASILSVFRRLGIGALFAVSYLATGDRSERKPPSRILLITGIYFESRRIATIPTSAPNGQSGATTLLSRSSPRKARHKPRLKCGSFLHWKSVRAQIKHSPFARI